MNVQDLSAENRPFMFFRFELTPDGILQATPLSEKMAGPFISSEALHAFVRSNLRNDSVYGEPLRLVRR
ncbi:MAG: hypothetical protein HY703_02505 [Gemmatimonadetes bacterium]|nr:hypothetical protein [Gemmatimonadota bacterium]